MALLHPFSGYLPKTSIQQSAADFIAPPYDVVTEAEVRKRVRGRPFDFLHVTRSDALGDEGLSAAKNTWQQWLEKEAIIKDSTPAIYVYRLEHEHNQTPHQQTGILACIDINDYLQGKLKRHELTRPDKETDRANHIVTMGGQLSPVLVCHKPDANITKLLAEITHQPPSEIAHLDTVTHSIWRVSEPQQVAAFIAAFGQHELYIADGHHRCAAAARAAVELATIPAAQQIFAGIFPSDELEILGYHRVLRNLDNFNLSEFLGALQELGSIVALDKLTLPQAAHQITFVAANEFYSLQINPSTIPNTLPDLLDSAWLTSQVLDPILGITDIRRDERIDFVGGSDSVAQIETLLAANEVELAFLLYPTSVAELMAVADAGVVMPPKSTWFEPKLADGLVSFMFK